MTELSKDTLPIGAAPTTAQATTNPTSATVAPPTPPSAMQTGTLAETPAQDGRNQLQSTQEVKPAPSQREPARPVATQPLAIAPSPSGIPIQQRPAPRGRGRPPKTAASLKQNLAAQHGTLPLGFSQNAPVSNPIRFVANSSQPSRQYQPHPAPQQQQFNPFPPPKPPQTQQQHDFPSYYNPVQEVNGERFYRILTELDPYRATPQEFIHLLVHAAVRDVEIAHTLFRWNDDRINHPDSWQPPMPPGYTAPPPASQYVNHPRPGNFNPNPPPTNPTASTPNPVSHPSSAPLSAAQLPTSQPPIAQPPAAQTAAQPSTTQPPLAQSQMDTSPSTKQNAAALTSRRKRKREESAEHDAKLSMTSQFRVHRPMVYIRMDGS